MIINGGTFNCSSRYQDGTYQHTLKAENSEVIINGGTFDATVNGQLTVTAFKIDGMEISLENNTVDGTVKGPQGYGMYIVPDVTDYTLNVSNNIFRNIDSHAVCVQGCGQGSAVTAAKDIRLTGNTFESWGTGGKENRGSMKMPDGHLRMIKAVAGANPNTVVVLLCGSPVECPWADSVKAILYMGLPGQAGGQAAADLLYGRTNPSVKLAESWPYTYDDVPSSDIYGKTADALYQEGIYVGYRYYDKSGTRLRWPFGYGLSYTDFRCSDLNVSGGKVSVTVTNTGKYPGAEVVQLFIAPPAGGLHRPLRELKGFKKVFLNPSESKTVLFETDDRSFAVWNDGWQVPGGEYTVCVGGMSAVIEKSGEPIKAPEWQRGSWYESCAGKPDQKDWEAMLGRSYNPPVLKKGAFTMDNTVAEMRDYSLVMKIMYKATERVIAKGNGGKIDYEDPKFRMLMASSAESPLRSMQISGGMKGGLLPGMLEMANGHFLRGLRKMIKG